MPEELRSNPVAKSSRGGVAKRRGVAANQRPRKAKKMLKFVKKFTKIHCDEDDDRGASSSVSQDLRSAVLGLVRFHAAIQYSGVLGALRGGVSGRGLTLRFFAGFWKLLPSV